MKLIVGLGNPGLKYSNTRHNIGFKVIKQLADLFDIKISKRCFGAKTGAGMIHSHRVLLALPQEFMNLSGGPLKQLVMSNRIKKEDLLVVCDDVNLILGHLRVRPAGSAGGHNGLKSIIKEMGHSDFTRMRIGVGKEGLSGDITGFVLGEFTRGEKKELPGIVNAAAVACEYWVKEGAQKTANKYNGKVN